MLGGEVAEASEVGGCAAAADAADVVKSDIPDDRRLGWVAGEGCPTDGGFGRCG